MNSFSDLFYFSRIDGPVLHGLPDYILVDFRWDVGLEFSRSNIEFAISWPKWSNCHETKRKHIDWTLKPQIWPSDLTLVMILTFNFEGQIWNSLSQPKMVRLPQNKSKHIDWTPSFKSDHQIWHWLWAWPLLFKVKYAIHCMSAKMVWSPQKSKHIYWTLSLKCDQIFTRAMTLTMNFEGQIWNLLYIIFLKNILLRSSLEPPCESFKEICWPLLLPLGQTVV